MVADYLSRHPLENHEETAVVPSPPFFFLPKVYVCALQRQYGLYEPIIGVLEGPTDGEHFRDKVLFYLLENRVLYRRVESDGQQRLICAVGVFTSCGFSGSSESFTF